MRFKKPSQDFMAARRASALAPSYGEVQTFT